MFELLNNETGELLEGVLVNVQELNLTTLSDSQCVYGIADNMPPGTYTIEFSLDGYGTKVNSVTVTSADETITVNVVMVAG